MNRDMWDKILDFVSKDDVSSQDFAEEQNLHMATAALFVHTAVVDEEFHKKEYNKINDFLKDRFGYNDDVVQQLIIHANRTNNEIMDVDAFIDVVNRNIDHNGQKKIVELIWKIVLADGVIHPFEDNLVRRVCRRFGISPDDYDTLKNNALMEESHFEDKITKKISDELELDED